MRRLSHALLLIATLPLMFEIMRMWFLAADTAAQGDGWKVIWYFDRYFGAEPLVDGIAYLFVVPAIWILNVFYWR